MSESQYDGILPSGARVAGSKQAILEMHAAIWRAEPTTTCQGQTWRDFAERCDRAREKAEQALGAPGAPSVGERAPTLAEAICQRVAHEPGSHGMPCEDCVHLADAVMAGRLTARGSVGEPPSAPSEIEAAIRPMVEAYRLWATQRMTASEFGAIADQAVIAFDQRVSRGGEQEAKP